MIDDIIIVTGARRLADREDSRLWVRTILVRELASATLVVAGDARGPDEWAHDIAAGMVAPIPCEKWFVDGRRNACTSSRWRSLMSWDDAQTPTDPRKRPLARNAAMVAYYARCARMVALYHPESTTSGTAHTVGLARRAGIDVTEYTWGGEL